MPYLEEVFRLSGIPTYTFVHPDRYDEIKVSVRTPGRCLVLEGPSGIGKTTTITKVLADLGISAQVLSLSARKESDLDFIVELPKLGELGTVIVDDFHRLDDATKARLSDFMKVLADSGSPSSKLILIGINKAGQQLVKFAHDLGLRVDVFKLETNSDEQIQKLITQGEAALNVTLPDKEAIARHAQGSFQIAQLLCYKLSVLAHVTETAACQKMITTSLNVAIEEVMVDLARQFKEAAVTFARGSKIRREGRAPYLHILRWLSETDEWSIDLSDAVNVHPDMKRSVEQVIDKGYLKALLSDPEKSDLFSPYFHYEPSTTVLSVEDPKLVFYLKNVIWRVFTHQVGYRADYFKGRYDFALSFAGPNRDLAKTLHDLLTECEVVSFYDESEQHKIIAENIEDYLAPIYRSEARYVVVLQSPEYPKRVWTKFESDNFRERFGTRSVIPIRYTTVVPGFFADDAKYGGLTFNPAEDIKAQAQIIAATLCKRIIEDKQSAREAEVVESIDPLLQDDPVLPGIII